jgi:hypothetical protein
VGSCYHVLFHQAVSATMPQGHDAGRAYPVAEAPRRDDSMPESLLRRDRRRVGWIGSEILSASV